MTRHITNQQGNKHHKKQNKKQHTDNTTKKCSLKTTNNLEIDE